MWPLKRIPFLSRPSRSWNVQHACDLKTQLTFHAFAWQCNSPRPAPLRPIDRQPVNWISFSWLFISLMNSARTRVAITAIDYSDRSLKSTDNFPVYEALTVFRKLISLFFFSFFSSFLLCFFRGRQVDSGRVKRMFHLLWMFSWIYLRNWCVFLFGTAELLLCYIHSLLYIL